MTQFTHTEKVMLLHVYGAQMAILLCVLWVCVKILIEDRRGRK